LAFSTKTRKGNCKCKYTVFIAAYFESWIICKGKKEKADTFFLIWVFEVVCLVKVWVNCCGVYEIRVCEVSVVDCVGVVDGEGIY